MNFAERVESGVVGDGDCSGVFEAVGVGAGEVEFEDVEEVCEQLGGGVGKAAPRLFGEAVERHVVRDIDDQADVEPLGPDGLVPRDEGGTGTHLR
ncbi:MAG TPA: hypothetical protein VLG28_04805 [Acidimicrobiia bacterium]|nr:hypothetical protein [Acidimicrobiia bacterium]